MKKSLVLFCLFSFFAFPKDAWGLSCVPFELGEDAFLDQAFEDYDGIVIGHVAKMGKDIRVDVEKSYKGVEYNTIAIKGDPGKGWGMGLTAGRYLLFLKESDGAWHHPLCSPSTKDFDQAAAYLKEKDVLVLSEKQHDVAPWFYFLALLPVAIILLSLRRKNKKQLN